MHHNIPNYGYHDSQLPGGHYKDEITGPEITQVW